MVTLPVSGSTSTSTICRPKALPTPPGLTVARPTIGPPVPFNQLAFNILSRLVTGSPHLKGHAAAAGPGAVPDGVGVDDGRFDRLHREAQHFRHLHGHGGSAAADVGRPFDHTHRAIGIDAGDGAGWARTVKPRPRRHPPALVRPR